VKKREATISRGSDADLTRKPNTSRPAKGHKTLPSLNADQEAQFTPFAWTDHLKRGRHPGLDGREGTLSRRHPHQAPLTVLEA
jgi:hypothetical protein